MSNINKNNLSLTQLEKLVTTKVNKAKKLNTKGRLRTSQKSLDLFLPDVVEIKQSSGQIWSPSSEAFISYD